MEGGATEARLTTEERMYQAAKWRYERAFAALEQWEKSQPGFSRTDPILLQLKKDVKEAQEGLDIAIRAVDMRPKKKQKLVASDEWMKDLKEKVVDIPEDIDKLRAFLQQQLCVKIPFSQRLSRWIQSRDTEKLCDNICQKLFEPFDGETSLETTSMVYNVMSPKMSCSDYPTEATYHHFWDSLVATVLTTVSYGSFLRHSNTSNSTRLCRPDLCFYYKKLNICVFRGEEKANGELIVPLNELCNKLDKWIYDDAPYLLGYAAVGLQLELATIQKDERGKAIVQVVEHYDLDSLVGRLQLFLAILNLSTLFRPLVNKVKTRLAGPEYGILRKENGLEIQFGTENVIKKYPSGMPASLAHSFIEHLKRVHDLMSKHMVPNVIRLVSSNMTKRTFCLTPIGYLEPPTDRKELVTALLEILNALIPMHKLKIIHRDLRWDNVLRYSAGGQKWFIIDFDDSAHLAKIGRAWMLHQARDAKDMARASHAPEIWNSSTHDEKIDIWSFGYLIQTSHLSICDELQKVKIDCMHFNPNKRPTALVVRDRLTKLQRTLG